MKCHECRRRMTKIDKKAYYCTFCRMGSYEIEPPPVASVLRLRPCPYCGAPAELYMRDEPRGFMVCCTKEGCSHDYETQVFMADCKSEGKGCPGYRIYIHRRMGKVVRKWNKDSRKSELRKKSEENPEDRFARRSWRRLE